MPDATTPVSTGEAEGCGEAELRGGEMVGGGSVDASSEGDAVEGVGGAVPLWITANAIAMTAMTTTAATTPRITWEADRFDS